MAAIGLPAPGNIPMKLPILADRRKCTGFDNTFSIVLRTTPFSDLYSATYSCFLSPKIIDNTCGTAKTPISAATKETPPRSSGMFSVKRFSSAAWLIPTQLINNPMAPPAKPFSMESPAKLPIIVSANIPSQKK